MFTIYEQLTCIEFLFILLINGASYRYMFTYFFPTFMSILHLNLFDFVVQVPVAVMSIISVRSLTAMENQSQIPCMLAIKSRF